MRERWSLSKENIPWTTVGLSIDCWSGSFLAEREFYSVSIIFSYWFDFATCASCTIMASVFSYKLIWSYCSNQKNIVWFWFYCLSALLILLRYWVYIIHISKIFFKTSSKSLFISIHNFSQLSIRQGVIFSQFFAAIMVCIYLHWFSLIQFYQSLKFIVKVNSCQLFFCLIACIISLKKRIISSYDNLLIEIIYD